MSLDAFDIDFRLQKGNPQDTLKNMIGLSVGHANAKKYIAGIRHYLLHKENLDPKDALQPNEMEEVSVRADGSRTTKRMILLSDEDSKNPQRIMELMGYDPLQWELVSCKIRRNYWDVTIKNKAWEGEKHTNNAFMCTVTAKPIQDILTTEYVKKIFADLIPPKLEDVKYKGGDKMLELPIMDVHLAKLGKDYNLEIATDLYKETVLDLLGQVKEQGAKIERIIFPIGQDFFHVDNEKSETTKGTRVETSSMWDEMYKTGTDLLVWAVEHLRQIAPVECMYVPGNHDEKLSYCATLHVDGSFRNIKDVIVDTSSNQRKYIEYGLSMFCLSHGTKEKGRIQNIMQIEQPEMWARTKVREFHMGHPHSEHAKEVGGIIFRRIASITASDQWHEDGAWLGAIRKAQAYIWDKNGSKTTIESIILT